MEAFRSFSRPFDGSNGQIPAAENPDIIFIGVTAFLQAGVKTWKKWYLKTKDVEELEKFINVQ